MSQNERLNKRLELRNYIAMEKAIMLGEMMETLDEQEDELLSGLGSLENPSLAPQSEGVALDFAFEGINAAEIMYTNSMTRLALFEYGEEFFSAPKALCGRNSLVSVNKDCFIRTEYDDLYRTLERTVWKNGESSSASTMVTRTRYTYANDEARIPKFCGQEFLDDGRYLETRFNFEGKPTEIVDYGVKKLSKGGVKRILKKKNNYTYDAKSRLAVESELENFDDGTSKSTKKIYTYPVQAKVPNVSYYEDGVLRIQTDYKSESEYTQTVFFEGEFKVVTQYRDNERTEEVIYLGELEVSRRTF